jgi:hypothetical protein
MAFKVQVGPAQIAIHQGQSVLLTEPDGQVNWPSNRGLYFRDTRVISASGAPAPQDIRDPAIGQVRLATNLEGRKPRDGHQFESPQLRRSAESVLAAAEVVLLGLVEAVVHTFSPAGQ